MSHTSELRVEEKKDAGDPNVIQLGFNISVAGKSASDFEIYVNDKKQACGQLSAPNLPQITSSSDIMKQQLHSEPQPPGERRVARYTHDRSSESEDLNVQVSEKSRKSPVVDGSGEMDGSKMDRADDLTIIDEIKNAMGNFERFSEHLREIPRLTTKRMYTSSPYPDKSNSRSEGNLSIYGQSARPFIPKHDFRDRKYFRKQPKPLSSDLFLKPLPAEDYFKRGFVRRYYDVESFHHYTSVDSIPQYFEYGGEYRSVNRGAAKFDNDKSDAPSSSSDICVPDSKSPEALKKENINETADKQSTSSESAKDIKIYQSGGIIIMQNFKEGMDLGDRKNLLDGAKLVESCSNLKEKIESSLQSSDDSQKLLLNSSSDDVKGPSGKSVQFDLSSHENMKSKSSDSLPEIPPNEYIPCMKVETGNLRTDSLKINENTPNVPQGQDFTSLSTQENDSVVSNLPGMSPTSSTSGKKLEWDSGADVGYLNTDLSKENLSTIERIILRALNNHDLSKKQFARKNREGEIRLSNSNKISSREPSEVEEVSRSRSDDLSSKKSISEESDPASRNAKSNSNSQSETTSACTQSKFQDSKRSECGGTNGMVCETPGLKARNGRVKYHSTDAKLECERSGKLGKTPKCHGKVKKTKEVPSNLTTSTATSEDKFVQTQILEKVIPTSSDKSVHVNTLFCDETFELPIDVSRSDESGRSESSDKCHTTAGKSPRVKKLTKKRNGGQGSSLTSRMKDKIDAIIDIARYSNRSDDGKKGLSSNEAGKSTEPSESKQEEKERVDAQRRNSKSDVGAFVSSANTKDPSMRSRPLSASSSSIRTIMESGSDSKANGKKNFTDQTMQTSERSCLSKGIQAFHSGKCSTASSHPVGESTRNVDSIPETNRKSEVVREQEGVRINLSRSKSIQAPGMNCSLPKHLAHPKCSEPCEQINTKSTQFFGCSVTSLPNYHSNVIGRESVTDSVKILKSKTSPDVENNRIKQENEKNVWKVSSGLENVIGGRLSGDSKSNSKLDDPSNDTHAKKIGKGTKANKKDPENKENLSVDDEESTVNSNPCSRVDSHKELSGGYVESKKSDSIVFGSCDVQLSDDSRSVFLTSDLLKVHCDSIDRNIIQKKYFESQLREIERQEMISRSTSMEKKKDLERNTQTTHSLMAGVSVSCQCSPSFVRKSERMKECVGERIGRRRTKDGLRAKRLSKQEVDQCDSISKKDDEETPLDSSTGDKDFGWGESWSSTTGSALSWRAGAESNSRSRNFVVGRAFSFEYLPGHVYENTKNLHEKSLSDGDHRADSDVAVRSNGTGSAPRSDNQTKESETGGGTIVLDNSGGSPLESNRMKSLDNNLTELEIVVSRLHEKEAIFQKITDSMLSTVARVNAAGDSTCLVAEGIGSNNGSQESEELTCEVEVIEDSSKSNTSKPRSQEKKLVAVEVSTACQTDSLVPESDHFYEERKKLEQRMSDEKEQQIKWIENEINHLNMLRSLLEKQEEGKATTQRRKRHHYLTESSGGLSLTSTLKEEILKKILEERLPKTFQDVKDVEAKEKTGLKSPRPKTCEETAIETVKELAEMPTGLSLSSRCPKNVQEVTMLPVGIQVNLKEGKSGSGSGNTSLDRKTNSSHSSHEGHRGLQEATMVMALSRSSNGGTNKGNKLNNGSSNATLASTDSKGRCRCIKCKKGKCVCSKPFESPSRRKSSGRSSDPSRKLDLDSTKSVAAASASMSEEFSKSDVRIPEIRDIGNSRGVSTDGTSTGEMSRSRDTSKQEESRISSDRSNDFEKCVCICHAEPLPRCSSCNLLNTCKKCLCYRSIQCCICNASSGSIDSARKKFIAVGASCFCKSDPCQMCRCSRVKNQVCAICPCHAKSLIESCRCRKKYEERSCQTEGKECKCCECSNWVRKESDLYRETKHMAEKQYTTEIRRPSEVVFPSERKYESEAKRAIEEKFPFQMKVPVEKKNSAEVKDPTQIKNSIEKRIPSEMRPVEVKEVKEKVLCRCMNSRKSVEEHPRHYFLELEETAEESSSESCDNRNSLEVITIKVPIRKVCKVSRNQNSSPARNARKEEESGDMSAKSKSPLLEQNSSDATECPCCEGCLGRYRQYPSLADRPRTADDSYSSHRGPYPTRMRSAKCCCRDCSGRLDVQHSHNFTLRESRDECERRKSGSIPQATSNMEVANGGDRRSSQPPRSYYQRSSSGYHYTENEYRECHCCRDCPGRAEVDDRREVHQPSVSQMYSPYPEIQEEEQSDYPSQDERTPVMEGEKSGGTENEPSPDSSGKEEKDENREEKPKGGKHKKGCAAAKSHRRNSSNLNNCHSHASPKGKGGKQGSLERNKEKSRSDYYNFNKKEFMTKSELEREEKKKKWTRLSLQECLTVKRPDLYTRAECRRKIISEKARDRAERHTKRMECISELLPQCDVLGNNRDLKLFTSAQMRKQTRKFYKKLPEVANKKAEEKKKIQFRTNRLMAEIFAKKLQLHTLKGCLNLSNSFTVMSTM